MESIRAAAPKRFNPKDWKKAGKTVRVPIRLIDGSEYEFEFRVLAGADAIALKREVFGVEKENKELLKAEKDAGGSEETREVDTSVRMAELDQRTLRAMVRACLVDEGLDDEDIDRLITATGGLHSRFGEAVYRACGVAHPKDLLRMMRPDLLEDIPFLSHARRARTGAK